MLGILLSHLVCAQSTYVLSADSEVKISGNSSIADWTVTGKNLVGTLAFEVRNDDYRKHDYLPTGRITKAEIRLSTAEIHSEKGEAMDNKVYKALRRDEHPTIHFIMQTPIELKNRNQKQDSVRAIGSMSIAGVTKPFSCDMAVFYDDNKWRFKGVKRMKMSDYQIEPPSAMFGQITTGDDIVIEVSLIYRPENAK